ncbi:hypothetical protein SAMN05443633_101286 [Chryseobacterium arachidis]|uniref:Cytochrome C551 n=1 Tax=Chryseobacterium arachidis TaxID=1416778 RepID=A0A1M4TP30_9FLAO|nr:cytochrome C551 [Chryseobacterium arachidis]SHE46145.1 hypothetical protein SAMN05443633_101286 [Chryseobacterium arachidis]
MKNLLLIAALGIFAISCGTKESSMTTNNSDSAAVNNTTAVPPATIDTVNTATVNPDSIKMKMDSANTVR